MSFLSRLERRFGRFAVPNLTLILIFGQVLLYVASYIQAGNRGDILSRLELYPEEVLAGEYWRVVTYLFNPPASNLLFAFLFWYLFYLFGTTLEATWGSFRYNLFLAIGYTASLAAAFGLYFSLGGIGVPASNGFLYGTVFLAFARLYPDFVLQLFFVLPVKVKWLALLQWIGYGIVFIFGPMWMDRVMVLASVANYLLFFGRDWWRDIRHGHRRMRFQSRAMGGQQRIVHKCRVCGLTSDNAPQTQFRYCSKCEGDCCYCAEHLRDHEHVGHTEPAVSERRS